MIIEQLNNCNILVKDSENILIAVFSEAYLNYVLEYDSILLSNSSCSKNIRDGVLLKASEVTRVNEVDFNGNVNDLFILISEEINLRGVGCNSGIIVDGEYQYDSEGNLISFYGITSENIDNSEDPLLETPYANISKSAYYWCNTPLLIWYQDSQTQTTPTRPINDLLTASGTGTFSAFRVSYLPDETKPVLTLINYINNAPSEYYLFDFDNVLYDSYKSYNEEVLKGKKSEIISRVILNSHFTSNIGKPRISASINYRHLANLMISLIAVEGGFFGGKPFISHLD